MKLYVEPINLVSTNKSCVFHIIFEVVFLALNVFILSYTELWKQSDNYYPQVIIISLFYS